MADAKKILGGLGKVKEKLLAEPPPAYSAKILESTTAKFADKIADANPKLTDAEVQKKALAQATKKLDWERVQKPALEKRYGPLAKASFAESNPNKMQNTAEAVAERKRKANEFLDQPTEPWTPPRPELQAFDRSSIKDALEGFPDVQQSRFPRDQPARASTSHVEELYQDPENRALIEKQIKRGLPLGGESFYASLYPVKQAVLEAGMPAEKFDKWIHSLAPASARNSIMNEMAVGQFLRNMNARGIPLSEENVAKEMALYKEKFGIGLPLMPIHRQGVANVLEGGVNLREHNLANIPTNYKIPTYGTQKAGDFAESTVLDVHEAGGHTQGSRFHPYFNEQGGFGNTEYGKGEEGLLSIAKDLGIPGGMAQAGRWFGGGELTGLKSPRGDALDLLEKQVAFTLQQKGIQPNPANVRKELLKQIETGEGDLLPWYRKEGMPDVRETGLQRAEGGSVDIDAADARLAAAIEKRMAKGGSVDIEAADARLEAAINARMGMAEGGQAEFKKIQFMADGGKLVKGLKNIGKKLFADSKVLPQAEREANLQKFLAPSAEKRRMYHGTKDPNITEFRTRKDMADEAGMSDHYADERDAVFLSPDPDFTKNFSIMGYTDEGMAPTTYPVYAQIERPFDFDNPEHLKKVKDTYRDMFHNPESEFYNRHRSTADRSTEIDTFNKRVDDLPSDENNWMRIENPQFQEVLKDLGFDSFYTRERGTKNLGIYDPNRIKSATGNQGTYDLGESDINKAEGGGAFKKLEFMADGGKLVKGATKVMKKLLAPQDDALKLAQERAALPVSQGGLGLPANNTPEQRAKAMGFNTEGFHGTDAVKDFKKFKTSPNDETGIKGVSFALDPKETDAYVTGRWTHEGYGGRVIPVLVRGNAPEEYLNLFEQVINNAKTYPETNMGQDRMLKKALKDSDSIGIDYSKSIGGTEFSVLEPDRIRSRFAAFDPFRKDTATAAIMGVAAPDLLAKEKEKKKADGGKIVGGLGKIAKKLLEEPKIQTIEAPSIIIPSKLSNVKEMARKREGEYGARRVERASDEIPNLEKMYQEDALRSAFIGDNARALMTMNPADFEKYASPVVQRARHWGSKGASDPDKANLPTEEYIKYLRTVGPFDEVPFLEINKQEQGLPLIPFISGHEGRHRNRALASAGENTSLVQLLPRAELREPFPRRSQEEYIDALKKELEMTNNLVDPQEFWSPDVFAKKPRIRLPTTKLPDLYAEGGAAFKTLQFKDAQHFDGGGIAFPEMTPMTEGSRREPLLTEKDWENIKRNAPEVYEWAKQNVKDEASQLKSARGVKDFALRTGAQYLGGIPDLLNLGLMGVDALADTNLSSEKPYFGSERYIDAMRKAGMVGENEFPIAETVAGVLMPAGLIKKGIKKISGAKPAKQEPKKRQGGLSAMAR